MVSLFYFLVLIFSVVIHEVSHGLAARAQGDDTAERAGRLTLNPLKHLDPVGSILLPAFLYFTRSPFLFGWALPVPFNPYNLRNARWGPALVAAAGPLSNIILATLFSSLLRLSPTLGMENLIPFLAAIVYLNLVLAIFNLVPIPPLDGSKVVAAFSPELWQDVGRFLERWGIFLLILFIVFGFPFIQPVFPFLLRLLAGKDALPALVEFLRLL